MRARRLAWLVLLATCGLLTMPAAATATGAEAAAASPPAPTTVVLYAVPGLLWSDVEAMPSLAALAARSAVGELSVKTSGSTTRCAAGLLAVSAGNRTAGPAGGCSVARKSWARLQGANTRSQYGASLGALGSALHAAGVRTTAVGPQAIPMLADRTDRVGSVATSITAAVSAGGVVAALDPRLYAVPDRQRAAARAGVDDGIAQLEQVMPAGATLIVAGISDLAGGGPHLHAVVVSGPGWRHTELRMGASARAPYVELIDIAPTILAAEHIAVPASMAGRTMQLSGSSVPRIASYVDDDRHAVAQRTLGQRTFLGLGVVAILTMLLASIPLQRAPAAARWLGRLLAPAPAMVFLGNAFPWWRWGQPSYAGIVIAGCVVVAAVTAVTARRSPTAGLLVAPAFSFLVLAADQLSGAHLQLSAPLGDDPLVAGRFAGMGNLDFAAFGTSALVIAGVLGARLSRRTGVVAATLVVLVAVVIDGAPPLGNDIGGVLTLVPAAIVAVALVWGVRLTWRGAVAIVVVAAAVAVLVAVADYARPAAHQTDVGRFVGQVLHGGAGHVVHRKLDAALASFGLTVGTFVAGFAVVTAWCSRRRLQAALAGSRALRAAAVPAAVLGVLGTALNDSGVTIAAMAAMIGVGALYGGGPLEAAAEPARS